MIYVNVYIGQTRAAGWIRLLEGYGFGEMCVREEIPPRRTPWAFDNGAFKDWERACQKTRALCADEFHAKKYEAALDLLWLHGKTRPDFIVAPDLPMGGLESLRFSHSWLPKLIAHGRPVYLVVQDGMEPRELRKLIAGFGGVFVGGSPEWKMRTAHEWVRYSHEEGMRCHIGRMGTEKKVRAALRWGADSIDSSLPLWSEGNLRRFLRGFQPAATADLALGVP